MFTAVLSGAKAELHHYWIGIRLMSAHALINTRLKRDAYRSGFPGGFLASTGPGPAPFGDRTIEQIRARLPASVAIVEELPYAGGAGPETERWFLIGNRRLALITNRCAVRCPHRRVRDPV